MLGLHHFSRRATLIAYASLLVVFIALPNFASAATLIAETDGTLDLPKTTYGGNGTPFSAIKVADGSFTHMAMAVSVQPGNESDILGFQWRTGASTWEDCKTDLKDASGWGIQSMNYTESQISDVVYFTFSGAECNTTALASASLFSVSALNTAQSFGTTYYYSNSGGTDRYLKIYDGNPQFAIGFNSETQTRFTNVSITGTSTVNVDATYWLEQSEIQSNISELNPTLISFEYSLRPGTDFTARSEKIANVILDGSQSTDTNLPTLSDGTYDLLVSFSNYGVPFGAAKPFPKSYVYTSFTITGGVLSATSTPEYYDYSVAYPTDRYADCAITNIACHVQNAFIFLLYPPEPSLQVYYDTLELIPLKFPFAYFYAVQDSFISLSDIASSTSPVDFTLDLSASSVLPDEITILSTSTVDSFLGSSARLMFREIASYVIWITFALMVFFRVRKLFG